MQWKNVGLGLIREQLLDSPQEVNGRVLFLELGTENQHTYGKRTLTHIGTGTLRVTSIVLMMI